MNWKKNSILYIFWPVRSKKVVKRSDNANSILKTYLKKTRCLAIVREFAPYKRDGIECVGKIVLAP